MKAILLTICLCFAMPVSLNAQGTVYYVSDAIGADSNPGTFGLPFKTIARGIQATVSGDVIKVTPGVYRESLFLNKSIVIEAFPDATLEPPPGALVGFDITYPTGGTGAIAPEIRGFLIDGRNLQWAGVFLHANIAHFGVQVLRPVIEENHFLDCPVGVWAHAEIILLSSVNPVVRFNLFDVSNRCAGVGKAALLGTGANGAGILAEVHGNRIFDHDVGLHMQGPTGSLDAASNVLVGNEQGIRLEGITSGRLINNTIAFCAPILGLRPPIGIEIFGLVINVDNCILWNPPTTDCNGNPVATLDYFDHLGRPNVVPMSNNHAYQWTPTVDPLFASVNGRDFRLQAASPLMNAGDNAVLAQYLPPVASMDADAAPRIRDGNRTGALNVDLGAYEFSDVSFDITAAYPGTNFSGRRNVQVQIGGSFTATATGRNGDSFFYWIDVPNDDFNVLWPNLGNQLANALTATPVPTTNGTATFTFSVSTNPMWEDEGLDLQGLMLDPLGGSPFQGSFTREIRLELNF